MGLWTITLLSPPPATRTIPNGDRLSVFYAGKPIPNCSDWLKERCEAINKVQGVIFKIVESHPAAKVYVPPPNEPAIKMRSSVEAAAKPVVLKKVIPVAHSKKTSRKPLHVKVSKT